MASISPGFSAQPVLANHVPAFETGFTPWEDVSDLFSVFDPPVSPVEVNPGLEKIVNSCDQIQNQSCFNTIPLNRTGSNVEDKEEWRKKRKLSNRESARRSREKKQKHLEDMRSQLNQLKTENQVLVNRLRYVLDQCQQSKMENDRLRLEHHILHEKFLNLRQALVLRQIQQSSTCATWSCINSTVVSVQQNPSMIN